MKCHSVWPRIWQEAAKNMSEALSYYPGPLGGQPPQRAGIHRLAQARGKTDEWLKEGTVREFRGGAGAKIKNIVSKATKCMKTLGELTKCHYKKAKIRRKVGLLDGHFRQFDTPFARNCCLRKGIRSDYWLRRTLRRAEGCRADGWIKL